MHRRLPSLLFAAVLCLVLPARAANDYASLLAEAERVRSADPARLEALLGQLNRDIAQATPEQRAMAVRSIELAAQQLRGAGYTLLAGKVADWLRARRPPPH